MSIINDFRIWLSQAHPGERFTYYTGDLYHDRQRESGVLPIPERILLSQLADEVYRAARTDQILLVQRRVGPSNFEYMAVRRRPPHRKKSQPNIRKVLNLVNVT